MYFSLQVVVHEMRATILNLAILPALEPKHHLLSAKPEHRSASAYMYACWCVASSSPAPVTAKVKPTNERERDRHKDMMNKSLSSAADQSLAVGRHPPMAVDISTSASG